MVNAAWNSRGRFRIVVAGDPDPGAPSLQRRDVVTVAARQPRRTVAVLEAVPERGHAARRITCDQLADARHGRGRVVRWQQLSARGEARAFFDPLTHATPPTWAGNRRASCRHPLRPSI